MAARARRPAPRGWQRLARRALPMLALVGMSGVVGATASGSLAGASGGPSADALLELVRAQYDAPTRRYRHGVLGDDVEYGALILSYANGEKREIRLPQERVFEDLAPRLADVDGDGRAEVVVVESHRDLGARLAIYRDAGLLAATPYIGRRYRWLAPVGVADLDGDGLVELAYIDRPHLAKTLRVWRFHHGALHDVATMRGLTNHRIGEAFITGGLRDCGAGPEMMVVSADWRVWQAVRLISGRLVVREAGRFDGPAQAPPCPR